MRKKKSTVDKEFNKIKNLLEKKSPEYFIASFKNNYPLDSISKYFNKIMDFPKLKYVQINNLVVKHTTNLHKDIVEINTGNIWFELSWTALIINKYKGILQDFPKMKLDFESEILLGNFENASIILDNIEEEFGHSFWLIRSRMILFQELEGIESQKKYLNTLTEKKDLSLLFQILVHFCSISVEKNVSATYFEKRLESFFAESTDSLTTEYVMFKLQKTYFIDPKSFTNILVLENSTSIIDIYETFIEIVTQTLLLKLEKNNEYNTFIKLLKKLDKSIDDARLINLQRTCGIKKQLTEAEKDKNFLEIYESFLVGEYNNVISLSQIILSKNPIYMSLYKNFLESLNLQNEVIPFKENTLVYNILKAYQNILLMNPDTDESIGFLFKVLVTYPHLSLSNYVFTFLYDYIQDNHHFKSKVSYFDNSIFSEAKYEIYPDNVKSEFLIKFREVNIDSIFIKLLITYENDSSTFLNIITENTIAEDNINVLLMYYYSFHEEYDKSKKFAKKLLMSENKFSQNEAKKIILKIFLKEDGYQGALFEIVNRFLENKNSSVSLPIIAVVDKLINYIDKTKITPSEIEASIIFYLSILFRNYEDFSGRLAYLYEYYLEAHGYKKPTDLINDLSGDLDHKTIFYLKNICTSENMEKSIYFEDIDEVENERIQVCHFLKLNDSENKEIYLQEIKEKEQSLFVRKESSRIKKNKIYVNIDGVKKLCSKELEDDYNRLLVLIQANNYKEDRKIVSILETLKNKELTSKNITSQEALSSVYLYNPESTEVDKLFDIIIHQIKDIFINNKDYGLDVYLSTKIRHGTISNQLRKPLEKENLITLRDKENEEYEDNPLFEGGVYKLDNFEKKLIQDYFKAFSLKHDEIIKELSNDFLQVSTSILRKDLSGEIIENENKKALFKYYFSTLESKDMLYSLLGRDITFEEFLESILKILWEKTDINLRNIRAELENNTKKEILNNFDILQASLSKISADISELSNAIARARTDTNIAIDNVISWFGRMQDSDINDYDMISAINIVQNTFKKEQNFCSIKGSIDKYFKGSTLDKFVDIYFIIFDNAFKHSGYQDETKIDVEFSLDDSNDQLKILISNGVNSEHEIEDLNNEIQLIKDKYGTKEAISSINKEGKTGFNKIWRIVTKDLDILEHQLNFEYIKKDELINFEIEIIMNVERLLV